MQHEFLQSFLFLIFVAVPVVVQRLVPPVHSCLLCRRGGGRARRRLLQWHIPGWFFLVCTSRWIPFACRQVRRQVFRGRARQKPRQWQFHRCFAGSRCAPFGRRQAPDARHHGRSGPVLQLWWVGFAGDDTTRVVFSLIVDWPRMLGIMVGMDKKDSYTVQSTVMRFWWFVVTCCTELDFLRVSQASTWHTTRDESCPLVQLTPAAWYLRAHQCGLDCEL